MRKIIFALFVLFSSQLFAAEQVVSLSRSEFHKTTDHIGKRDLVETPTCIIDSDGELSIYAMGEVNSVSIKDDAGFVIFETFANDGSTNYSIPALSQGNYVIEVEIVEDIYEGFFSI